MPLDTRKCHRATRNRYGTQKVSLDRRRALGHKLEQLDTGRGTRVRESIKCHLTRTGNGSPGTRKCHLTQGRTCRWIGGNVIGYKEVPLDIKKYQVPEGTGHKEVSLPMRKHHWTQGSATGWEKVALDKRNVTLCEGVPPVTEIASGHKEIPPGTKNRRRTEEVTLDIRKCHWAQRSS